MVKWSRKCPLLHNFDYSYSNILGLQNNHSASIVCQLNVILFVYFIKSFVLTLLRCVCREMIISHSSRDLRNVMFIVKHHFMISNVVSLLYLKYNDAHAFLMEELLKWKKLPWCMFEHRRCCPRMICTTTQESNQELLLEVYNGNLEDFHSRDKTWLTTGTRY